MESKSRMPACCGSDGVEATVLCHNGGAALASLTVGAGCILAGSSMGLGTWPRLGPVRSSFAAWPAASSAAAASGDGSIRLLDSPAWCADAVGAGRAWCATDSSSSRRSCWRRCCRLGALSPAKPPASERRGWCAAPPAVWPSCSPHRAVPSSASFSCLGGLHLSLAATGPNDVVGDFALACHLLLAPWRSLRRSIADSGRVTVRALRRLLNGSVNAHCDLPRHSLAYILRSKVGELPAARANMVFGDSRSALCRQGLQELLARFA